jgi:hypothetical protein
VGGAAHSAGVHPRLVKYISIVHPRVSGRAQAGGAVRFSVRTRARDTSLYGVGGPGFGRAPRPVAPHPLSDLFVEPDAE